ncbi:MAG: winged helix-turn-helix domain-containing protein [Synechococcus sp. Tobar2m-G35]|nr:winged helix-turn-helix domain-containing protein [Synechococcus sp. Tobar2m-G35]
MPRRTASLPSMASTSPERSGQVPGPGETAGDAAPANPGRDESIQVNRLVEQLISSMDELRDGGHPLLNRNALQHLVAALATFSGVGAGAFESDRMKELRVGPLTLDPRSLDVTVHDRPLNLTRKEYDLLRFLLSHRGEALARERILEQVWDRDHLGKENLLDVYIRSLRSKLRPVGGEGMIQTLRGTGYIVRDWPETIASQD